MPQEGRAASPKTEVLRGSDDEVVVVGPLVVLAEDEDPELVVVIGPLVVIMEDEDEAVEEVVVEEMVATGGLQVPH
jgi:hypothetical protein